MNYSQKISAIAALCIGAVMPFAMVVPAASAAQWCGTVWSDYPCAGYTGAPAYYNPGNSSTYNSSYNYGSYPSVPTSYNYNTYPSNYGYNTYQNSYNYPYQNYNNYSYGYTNPAPSCTISVTPTYSSNYGSAYYGYNNYGYNNNQSVIISWYSTNASSASIQNYGAVALSGSMSVTANANSVYSMTVTGAGGTNTCQTTYYQPVQQYNYQYQQPQQYQYGYNSYQQYPQYNYGYGQNPYSGYPYTY